VGAVSLIPQGLNLKKKRVRSKMPLSLVWYDEVMNTKSPSSRPADLICFAAVLLFSLCLGSAYFTVLPGFAQSVLPRGKPMLRKN
jgi:hypothetical protein